jgi:hypothetical protein
MRTPAIIAAALLASCAPAHADYASLMSPPVCLPYNEAGPFLAEGYGEVLHDSEVSDVDGMVYQFYVNSNLGTFTLVRLSADGSVACAVAYGQAAQFLDTGV